MINLLTWCKENNKEHLIEEWDYERNIKDFNLSIEKISYGSEKKVWWKCKKEGHSWLTSVNQRTRKQGRNCPYCNNTKVLKGYNDFKSWCKENNKEYLINEWDYEKNSDLIPDEITKGSKKKVYWKCKHNHSWKATVNDRSNGSNCPSCGKYGTSFPEQYIYYVLKKNLKKCLIEKL